MRLFYVLIFILFTNLNGCVSPSYVTHHYTLNLDPPSHHAKTFWENITKDLQEKYNFDNPRIYIDRYSIDKIKKGEYIIMIGMEIKKYSFYFYITPSYNPPNVYIDEVLEFVKNKIKNYGFQDVVYSTSSSIFR